MKLSRLESRSLQFNWAPRTILMQISPKPCRGVMHSENHSLLQRGSAADLNPANVHDLSIAIENSLKTMSSLKGFCSANSLKTN